MLPSDYDTFLKKLEDFSRNVQANGGMTAQVYIKPQDFATWCNSEGIPADTRARMRYAARVYNINSQK